MQSNEPSSNQVFLQKLTEAVLENLQNEQFSVKDLSKHMGISRSQLHRKLKMLVGKSVSQFIGDVRLEEAMKMLRDDVATASEIAYRVGFSSPSYFYKCFHKFYGFPPGDVKKHPEEGQINEAYAISKNTDVHLKYNSDNPSHRISQESWRGRIFSKKNQTVSFVALLSACVLLIVFIAYQFVDGQKKSTNKKSIAVLPFKSLSSDEDNQHFTDGLVDDLLSRLALIDEFKVISQTSSETYRGQGLKRVGEISAELGVSFIVEGSVQQDGDKVRIIVQLIDALNDDHIWVKTFDRDLLDVFKVQSEIAIQIATGLSTVLTEKQTQDIQKNKTENVKAMELYQLGRHHWGKRTFEGMITAIDYFEQAIEKDPEYALAYAGMADTYYMLVFFDNPDMTMENRNKALEFANKALDIDSQLVEAYTVLASVYSFVDWNWAAGEENFKRGLSLNSNYSTLYHRYSEQLSITQRYDEARIQIDKAVSLDPLSFIVRIVSADIHNTRGNFNAALKEYLICSDLNLNKFHQFAHKPLFTIYCHLEDGHAALETYKQIEENLYPQIFDVEMIDSLYQVSGYEALIKRFLKIEEDNLDKAQLYAFLGDRDNSINYIEKAINEDTGIAGLSTIYEFRIFYDDPHYIALLNEMGLPWQPDNKE